MSEIFDKQVNVQKENLKKNFWGLQKFPKPMMKMKIEEKQHTL